MTDIPPNQLRGAVDLSSLVRGAPGSAAGGAAPGSVASGAGQSSGSGELTVPSLVFETSEADFAQVLEFSKSVAVIVELHGGTPSATLESIIRGFRGKFLLARVDARANPQIAQAFQAAAVPTVAAVIGGRPVALYEGELPEAEAKPVFDQVVSIAAENGVSGIASEAESSEETSEPVEEPLPPHHQEAFDAIDRGDYHAAIDEYRSAIAQNPRDVLAVAGLAQVSLLARLEGHSAEDIRAAAAERPNDLEAQLAVADLDVSGGHLEDAFARLLELFPAADQKDKDVIRARLLSYFEIAGAEEPRVVEARRRLTSLLY